MSTCLLSVYQSISLSAVCRCNSPVFCLTVHFTIYDYVSAPFSVSLPFHFTLPVYYHMVCLLRCLSLSVSFTSKQYLCLSILLWLYVITSACLSFSGFLSLPVCLLFPISLSLPSPPPLSLSFSTRISLITNLVTVSPPSPFMLVYFTVCPSISVCRFPPLSFSANIPRHSCLSVWII